MKEKVIGTSKLNDNNRVTLLKEVRGLIGEPEPGDTIVFYKKGDDVVIRKA